MKSALYRQISESVMIQYQKDHHIIPNTKSEYNRTARRKEYNSEMEKMTRGEKNKE